MSAVSIIKGFHPCVILLLCLLVVEFQIVLRSDLPIPERIFYLALLTGLELGLIIFEVWFNEHFETKGKDEGQVSWKIPKAYGGQFTTNGGE